MCDIIIMFTGSKKKHWMLKIKAIMSVEVYESSWMFRFEKKTATVYKYQNQLKYIVKVWNNLECERMN